MNRISLLDCTLRDGGYINDWDFGHDELICLYERIVSSGVDIIEVGFLDDRRTFDINRSIMPDTDSVERIYGRVDRRKAMIVGMIDYGTCSLSHISKCEDSYLDGIRVIFKKHMMKEAVAFCRELKKLGYQVFVQAVSITSYSDEELLKLISLVNEIEPYAVSLVDTYGLLHQDSLLHYFNIMDDKVKPAIGIGYHSHNNFQLGFANCIDMLETKSDRHLIVDATLYGMGKSAGNTPIELLAMHLNNRFGKNYDISQLLEAIDGNIMKIYKKHPWGYNLFYYLAASNNCHPNYVKTLLDKHTLSMKSINRILANISDEKKLLFDANYIEELYVEYQSCECDDSKDLENLSQNLSGKKLLLLGPGQTIQSEERKIRAYIDNNNPIIISTNFIPGAFHTDYVFVSNSRRYTHIINDLKEYKNLETKVIATSNVTEVQGAFDYVLNNAALLDLEGSVTDHSFVMLLRALIRIGITDVACAGFDGYSEDDENYYKPDMEYWFSRRKAREFNKYVTDELASMKDRLEVTFITTTKYKS